MKTNYSQRIEAIKAFFSEQKRLPTYREMLKLFQVKSTNAVARVVEKLTQDKWVVRDEFGKLVPNKLLPQVKILGAVEAGFPSAAEEELVDSISLDQYLIRKREASFLLRVTGESMSGAGIMPNDLVVIERGKTARNGDIVIAEVDGHWTIKRIDKRGRETVLLPDNPRFRPIYPERTLSIAGVVVGVIRKYH